MKIVKREGIKAPYGTCIDCGVGTRSHVLEYPDYEEFEEEIPEELQEFQGRKKFDDDEDPEVIIRYRRLTEPEVMCHRCWVQHREKAVTFLNKNKDKWDEDIAINMTKIRKFLNDWGYFDFSGLEKTVVPKPEEEDLIVQALRKQVKAFIIGREEE